MKLCIFLTSQELFNGTSVRQKINKYTNSLSLSNPRRYRKNKSNYFDNIFIVAWGTKHFRWHQWKVKCVLRIKLTFVIYASRQSRVYFPQSHKTDEFEYRTNSSVASLHSAVGLPMTNRDRAKVVPYQNRHTQSFPPFLGAPHSLWSLKMQPSLNAALPIIRLKISQQAWQRETRQRGIGKFLLVLLFAVSWSHRLSLIWATLWQRWLMEFLCTRIGSHGWFKGIITLYGIASPDH